MLERSTMGLIMLRILLFIFVLVVMCLFSKPLHCDSFVSDMDNGTIARTPLLQAGQTLATLQPNLYKVTGGYVNVGYLPRGNVIKIIGVMVDNSPTTVAGWEYQQGNQPFNKNFAKVLYELNAIGKSTCSYSSLDYVYAGRDNVQANLNSLYLQGFKAARGLGVNSEKHGEFHISKKILNALAEQEH